MVAETARVCSECGRLLPLTAFRRRNSRGPELRRQCNACHREGERRRLARRRDREFAHFVRAADRAKADCQLVAVVQDFLRRCGGVPGLAGILHRNIATPGRHGLRALRLLVRLLEFEANNLPCGTLAGVPRGEDSR